MADQTNGTATEQPADDLRSALMGALAESEAPDTGADTVEGGEGAKSTAATRARDEAGRFAKGQAAENQDTAAADDTLAADTVQADTVAGAAEQPVAPTGAVEPPSNWPDKDKETFKSAPANLQGWLLERNKAMQADYTKKTQEIAHIRNEYGPIDEMFTPHKEQMRAAGFTPQSLIRAWHQVEVGLMNGKGVEILANVAKSYKVDPAQLAQALGITGGAAPAQPQAGQQPAPVDPQFGALQGKLQTLEQKIAAREKQESDAKAKEAGDQIAKFDTEIESFKTATDDKGQLVNPHYAEVEPKMIQLASAYWADGKKPPALKDLYEEAVWATPSTREKALTAKQQSEDRRKADEARARAAAAKKAGSSVTGAPGPGQSPKNMPVDKSLRQSLEEAADNAA